MILSKIYKLIAKTCNYINVNNKSDIQLRDHKEGIQLIDAFAYKLFYSNKGETKESVVSKINLGNKTLFTRQAYESKENHIPSIIYENILNDLRKYSMPLKIYDF